MYKEKLKKAMKVERKGSEIVLRLPDTVNASALASIMSLLQTISSLSQNKGTEEEALSLAEEVDKKWWRDNAKHFCP